MSQAAELGGRFSEALSYAAEIHRDQTRKNGDTPYVGHLLGVTGLVIEHGGDEDEAIGALLHDAAEDQGGEQRLREIGERFGERVERIVAECSDTLETPKPPWRERKQRYIEHVEHAGKDSILVSLADKLDNARSILRDLRLEGAAVWDRFRTKSAADQLWYYRSLIEVFERREAGPMIDELRRTVDEIEALNRDGAGAADRGPTP